MYIENAVYINYQYRYHIIFQYNTPATSRGFVTKSSYLECFPDLEAYGRRSPTETSYQSFHVPESLKEKLTVDLPAKPHKEEPQRREIIPDGFQPVVANGKVLGDALNNNRPKDTRRHTFPSLEPPQKEEHAKVKRSISASPRSLLEEKTKINLSNDLFDL